LAANKNIFCASNPARLCDALWSLLVGRDFSDDIIFLPSRRAIRTVEKFIADKSGSAVLLPKLVALGEEVEEEDVQGVDVVSNQERILVLAKMLDAAEGMGLSTALTVARDLVRMADYIENEGQNTDNKGQKWSELIDEKYAKHFQKKAEFLTLADSILPSIFPDKITEAQKRNQDIRDWIQVLQKYINGRIIICGSTASVPATSDLMEFVAGLDNGYIILPGGISKQKLENINLCSPYYSEIKFLERIGIAPEEIHTIDVGESAIEFFNNAFSNNTRFIKTPLRCERIDCNRESEEAEVAAEIVARAIAQNKTVLVITPDAAGNQRLREAFAHRDLQADFSGGISGAMTLFGRAILNNFDEKAKGKIRNLFEFIDEMSLEFSESDLPVIEKLNEVSDILLRNGIVLESSDARAVVLDSLSSVQIRPTLNDDAKVRVLGTIESRMQTADIVILTGLNEGMFPALGYENPWLPRRIAEEIGLPPPERKVSLMAMDFINLSCGGEAYWLRSTVSGGAQTTESRFLSRIEVVRKAESKSAISKEILEAVRVRDNVPFKPLDYSPPTPPADRSPVYVTELELLIHNPYAFYAKHILRLKPKDDWWAEPGAKEFGTLVHSVIERRAQSTEHKLSLIEELDSEAKKILPADSVLFHFWHKRFLEIAPAVEKMLAESVGGESETKLETIIAGRAVRAIADRVWDDVVLDIKTGSAPNKSQLEQGNMPQLPLEAYMRGAKIIQFLQLKNNDVKLIEYSGEQAQAMIDTSVQKVSELFGRYSKDAEPYEYYENTDAKYKAYDDLARADD